MSDLPPNEYPQVPPDPAQPAAQPALKPARKPFRWLIALAAGLVLVSCACVVLAVALLVKNLGQIPAGMAASQQVIDQFMQAGVAQDVNAAYGLFSKKAQDASERARLEQLFGTKNRTLFSGYQKVEINSFIIHASVDPGSDLTLSTVATVEGVLYYQNGRTRRIEAVVEQQDGAWKIKDIDVNLLPNRNSDGKQT